MSANVMDNTEVGAGFGSGFEARPRSSIVRLVRASLFMSSGWFRLLLAVALTGAIWGLVFSVVSG